MNRGKVEQMDEPSKVYRFPRSRFVADFIVQCNLFGGTVSSNDGSAVTLDVAGLGSVRVATRSTAAAGASGSIALRPEQIRIGSAAAVSHGSGDAGGNRFRGTVSDLLYMGDVTVYRVATEGGARVEALLANSQTGRAQFFEPGDAVEMDWPAAAGHFIDE
ncbi:MAG TPA: TOBE domain-containing protein [Casimicrobiaceae bacterium]